MGRHVDRCRAGRQCGRPISITVTSSARAVSASIASRSHAWRWASRAMTTSRRAPSSRSGSNVLGVEPQRLGVRHRRPEPLAGQLREPAGGHPDLRLELHDQHRPVEARVALDEQGSARGESAGPAVDGHVLGARRGELDDARHPGSGGHETLLRDALARTASTSASRTETTDSSKRSWPRQSASAPAATARTAPSSTPTVSLIAFISSASVTTRPSNPSSMRSRSWRSSWLMVAGTSPSERTTMWRS